MKVTVAELKNMYTRCNHKWFRNVLPPVDEIKIGFKVMGGPDAGMAGWSRGRDEVFINQRIRFNSMLVESTLIHEMAHMRLPDPVEHGPRFKKEMRRLLRAGAFDDIV